MIIILYSKRVRYIPSLTRRLVLEDSDDSIEDDLETYRDGSISNCNYSSDGGGSDTDCTRKGTLTFSEILKRRLAHNHHPPHSIFPRCVCVLAFSANATPYHNLITCYVIPYL